MAHPGAQRVGGRNVRVRERRCEKGSRGRSSREIGKGSLPALMIEEGARSQGEGRRTPEAGKGKKTGPPIDPQKEHSPAPRLDFRPSGLQNRKIINVWLFSH